MIFGVLSLLLVVAVIGIIANRQLSTPSVQLPQVPGASTPSNGSKTAEPAPVNPQQQVQQAVQGLMQQPRPMPEGK